jgi:hypothetical protein
MNIYEPIIIVGIVVAFVIVGLALYDQLTAATRDKRSECNTRYIKFIHRIESMIGAKQSQMHSLSGRFRLSDDYQIRSDMSSIINDGNQLRAYCGNVIDVTHPPSGYGYEE